MTMAGLGLANVGCAAPAMVQQAIAPLAPPAGLVHYSGAPLGPLQPTVQGTETGPYDKPDGLWVTVEGDDGWEAWCRGNEWGLDRLACVHDVVLDSAANILCIADTAGLDALTARYGRQPFGSGAAYGIEWARVATDYQGIIIVPYVWKRAHSGCCTWYYGWDCASGCIWDAAAVRSVTLRSPADGVPAGG